MDLNLENETLERISDFWTGDIFRGWDDSGMDH